MRLTGTMRIELTDVNTGEVTAVMEENMVTDAVNHILGLNPMGVFYEIMLGQTGSNASCHFTPSIPVSYTHLDVYKRQILCST